jgi:pteridine reductase
MTDRYLLGKVAVVTGGAIRLGRAISLALASQGADIVLHYQSSAEEAHQLSEEIGRLGCACLPISIDLSKPEAAAALFKATQVRFQAVDILINSAAVFPSGNLGNTSPNAWDQTLNVNLRAPFLLCQCFAAQTKDGNIINIVDGRVTSPDPEHVAYAVSKAALSYLTKTLAVALAPDIRVNGVAPGAVLPPAGAARRPLESMLAEIPLHRLGSPEDVAQAVLYLLRSPFVTGEILQVTGGQFLSS